MNIFEPESYIHIYTDIESVVICMKIEKINDNQIKCTLDKSDLVSRKIKLSELAYGTDKAKALFSEMMQLAASEVGFVAEDIPIMIEAIPVSSDSIILLVTKVEDPEELDTRFSQFSPYPDDIIDELEEIDISEENVLDLFKHLKDSVDDGGFIPLSQALSEKTKTVIPEDIIQIFSFNNIDTVCDLGKVLKGAYDGKNTLYKLPDNPLYYLAIHSSGQPLDIFNSICNIISEYGSCIRGVNTDEAFYIEHGTVICADSALQKLSTL